MDNYLSVITSVSCYSSKEDHNSEKRFTRSEMDKVIREKNLYKEKYLELQEDLR